MNAAHRGRRRLCEGYVSSPHAADGTFSCTAARNGTGALLAGGEPDFLYSELDKYILYFRQEEITPVFVFDGFDPLAALPWETVQERVQRAQKRMALEREAQDAFWRGAETSTEAVSTTFSIDATSVLMAHLAHSCRCCNTRKSSAIC